MGSAKHKKQFSTLRATTLLDPGRVTDIARQTADSIRNNIPSWLPGGAFVQFEEADSGKLLFTVRGGGHRWTTKPVMVFVVNLTPDGTGRTAVNTRIESFRTDQTTAYFIFPISPKTLEGYETYRRFVEQLAAALAERDPYTRAVLIERPNHPEKVLAAGPAPTPSPSLAPQLSDERPHTPDGYRDPHHYDYDSTAEYRRQAAQHFDIDTGEAATASIPLRPPTSPPATGYDPGPPPSPSPAPLISNDRHHIPDGHHSADPSAASATVPNHGTFRTGRAAFKLDRKALTVAGAAMGVTFLLWALKEVLAAMFGGAGLIIVLLMLVGVGGYVIYRGRNPERTHHLEARVQQLTQNAAGRLSAAGRARVTPPVAYPTGGGNAYLPPRLPGLFPGIGTPQKSAGTDALVSAGLLIPTFIAYAWRYSSIGFTNPWQPWWILTGLNLYFVVCVISRTRTQGAVVLALIGSGLIGLADNPSENANLMSMLSTKQYDDGVSYSVPPSPDVVAWIVRVPTLAILIFVAAWGIARRRRPGWVFGLIPAGLLVWWSIYGAEHGFGAGGGWFQYWLMSVGVFVGGCICCWLAELLTSAGGVNSAMPPYAPPVRTGLSGPPETWAGPIVSGKLPAHADYREQAIRHFQRSQPNPTTYRGGQTDGPSAGQGGPH